MEDMKGKQPFGILLLCLGAVLLIAALLLSRHNKAESSYAGQASDEALYALQAAIAENRASSADPTEDLQSTEYASLTESAEGSTEGDTEKEVKTNVPELPIQTIDGRNYVGYLSIPDLELNLPVMKLEYLSDLQVSPCLELGSPYSDNAVICAHNYSTHFGRLKELKGGEEITFTDVKGKNINYTVTEIQTIAPTDVDIVRESEHDLVLYTCTTGGKSRVMVTCDKNLAA